MIWETAHGSGMHLPDDMTSRANEPAGGRLRTRRILIVDDAPEMREMLVALVRRIRTVEVRVVAVESSKQAIELASEQPFDLVVSDYLLDTADGLDVLAAARRRHPAGLRVLLTGLLEIPAPLARIQAAGVDAYVQKPVAMQDLLLLLITFLHYDTSAIEEQRDHARTMERTAGSQAGEVGGFAVGGTSEMPTA